MNFLECILKQERKRAENFGVLNKSGEWSDMGVVFCSYRRFRENEQLIYLSEIFKAKFKRNFFRRDFFGQFLIALK